MFNTTMTKEEALKEQQENLAFFAERLDKEGAEELYKTVLESNTADELPSGVPLAKPLLSRHIMNGFDIEEIFKSLLY